MGWKGVLLQGPPYKNLMLMLLGFYIFFPQLWYAGIQYLCALTVLGLSPLPPLSPLCHTSSTSRPVDLREHVVSVPSLRASSQKIHILCEWPFPGPFICSIIHSGLLLGTYCVPDTVLGIRDTTVKRQTSNPPGA